MVVMKGLPLAYGKDMQEDKVPTFEAFDALDLALAAMAGMIARYAARSTPADGRGKPPAAAISTPPPISPTGWCGELDLPFRQAHHATWARR